MLDQKLESKKSIAQSDRDVGEEVVAVAAEAGVFLGYEN